MLQDFKTGKVDTAFIPKHEEELAAVSYQLLHRIQKPKGPIPESVKRIIGLFFVIAAAGG